MLQLLENILDVSYKLVAAVSLQRPQYFARPAKK